VTPTGTAAPGNGRRRTPTATPQIACPDLDGDGRVTIRDVLAVVRRMAQRRFDPRYDVNGDGRVDFRDVLIVVRAMGRRC
jgi:hypothetical protein